MSWYLDNVYERNKESPYTFYVPSKQVIDMLSVGDMVKLIFVSTKNEEYASERMWVEISYRQGKHFKGMLAYELLNIKDLKYGQEITFQTEHICDTEYEDPTSSRRLARVFVEQAEVNQSLFMCTRKMDGSEHTFIHYLKNHIIESDT